MTILKRTGNNDVGTPTKVGGNDWDELYDFLNGVSLSGKSADVGTATNFQSGKISLGGYADLIKITAPGNPASGSIRLFPDNADNKVKAKKSDGTVVDLEAAGGGGGDVTGAANVGTGQGLIFRDEVAGVLNLKKLLAGSGMTVTNGTDDVTLIATGGAASLGEYTYLLYIAADGSYKARNGLTGADDFSSGPTNPDAGAVLGQIFNSVSVTTPLSVHVGKGIFTVRSWNVGLFRHSNFMILGQGSGVTSFLIHDDVLDVAGNNRVFAFETDPTTFSSIALAADAGINSFAVMVNDVTDLANGQHIIIGAENVLPLGSARTGEHNRIVKIVATGGSPSHRIILEKLTRYAYTTANTASIRRVDFLENNHLEGFEIRSFTGSPTANIAFLRFDFAYNLHVKDVRLKDWAEWETSTFHTGFITNNVVNSLFDDMEFEQSPERGHGVSENPTGYAISCRAGCETVYFSNCLFMGLIRHGFTTTANGETAKYGHPINIWLINCNAETTTEASFDSHGEGSGIHYVNCSTHSSRNTGGTDSAKGNDDTDAFGSRCNNTSYVNCSVENNEGVGFPFGAGTHGHQLVNCKVRNIYQGKNAVQIDDGAYDIQINGLMVENIDDYGITIDNNAHNIQISNVHAVDCCNADTNLAVININGTGVKDIQLDNIFIDTSANPTTVVPIRVAAGAEGITMSNVTLVGGTKDCDIQGMNVKWDDKTCRGRQLSRPAFKIGSFHGNHSFGDGLWPSGILTDTGGSKRVESTDGTFREYSVSGIGTIEGFRVSTYTERDQNPYIRFRFRSEQTTGLRFFMGWSSDDTALGPAGADPQANKSCFMIKLDTTVDNDIKIYHNSGDATTTTGATIAAVDNGSHIIELRANNGAAGFQWRWDQGAWSSVITTDIPATTTDLGVQFYVENQEDTVAKNMNMISAYTEIKNF